MPAPPNHAWTAGFQVDRFVLEKELGAGGMGVVYQARDVESGAAYALKTIMANADPELILRFQREGEAQARADSHPNVVKVHSAGIENGRHYLVMDLASGGDLAQRLKAGPLDPRSAAHVVRELARGLVWLHHVGVLHRDLKPANVLFDERGVPKLVDFGLAQVAGAEVLTQTGTILGTPNYMAPEQTEGRREAIGPAADVYGLGAVLYHCLTGRPPFQGSSAMGVMYSVINEEPTPPRELAPNVPARLEAICLRCLSKRPVHRYASAAELGEELEHFLQGTRSAGGAGLVAKLALPILGVFAAIGAVLLWPAPPALAPAPQVPKTDRQASAPAEPPPTKPKRSSRDAAPLPLPEGVRIGDAPNEYVNTSDGSVLVWIPGSRFTPGGPGGALDELHATEQEVKGFFIGKYELTREQYQAYRTEKGLGAAPKHPEIPQRPEPEHPAFLTWHEANDYCAWAGLRLLTETEWEFAAAGRSGRKYPWGDKPPGPRHANISGTRDGYEYLAPVGTFPDGATPEGCLDMAGNAFEWTSTLHGGYGVSASGAVEIGVGRFVHRGGGSWSLPEEVGTRKRGKSEPNHADRGLRVARDSQ